MHSETSASLPPSYVLLFFFPSLFISPLLCSPRLVLPHVFTVSSQMQSLTSCQCSVCCGCFQQHFTIAVRDKHIRDMVCPVCWEPDINDPEHLNSYFSTLDIQVKPAPCVRINEFKLQLL